MFNDDDFDALFTGGDPRKKFFDIVYNANRNLVELEIDRLIQRMVVLESLIEEDEHLEKKIRSILVNDADDVEREAINMYMNLTASILSNNE